MASQFGTVFMLLVCVLLVNESLGCNKKHRFNKQNRYYRRHNFRQYGKRSAVNYDQAENSANKKYEFVINTTCGDVLCDSASNYPREAIMSAVKELQQIYKWKKAPLNEEIDPDVTRFLTEHLKTDDSLVDFPEIIYEEAKGCQAYGNVSFPQEGYSNDDGEIYYVVNVPNFRQKANHLVCKRSEEECGDPNILIPATYYRTCQQVDREEEFLVLPKHKSRYSVDDFQVRAFFVPNGCKCILLHSVDYDFSKTKSED